MSKKRIKLIFVCGLLLAGIIIKLYYINYTETWQRQHDVISFGASEGHAAYIEYILNNRHLPDMDPRERWGFFQPPLHHIVSANVIAISEALGMDEHRAQENTQVMTCLYMLCVMLFVILIFRQVTNRNDKSVSEGMLSEGYITVLSVVGVHPIFTLLSGSINNDALALVLSVTAVFLASYWYDNPSYLLTVLLALTIGLAMFAKLTGGLVAVPIGILMVKKFLGFDSENVTEAGSLIKLTDRIKLFVSKYLVKAALFAVIVCPIGLYWSIRNKIRWNMPINYIPGVGENFPETVTLKDRLFTFKTSNIYSCLVNNGDAYDEYSLPISMMKTSVFGEYNFSEVSRWMKPLAYILFVSAILLAVISFVAMIYVMSKKQILDIKWKILLFGTWAAYFMAYASFALSSSNFSAQDFRYAAICIACEGIFAGLYVDATENKFIKYGITALSLVFAVSSFGLYFILGYKS